MSASPATTSTTTASRNSCASRRAAAAIPSPTTAAAACALGPYGGMKFPLLASNVLDVHGKPALAPYAILRRGGVRIGFIGAVTKTTPGIVTPSGVAGLRFIDEADGVNAAARQLRARGVHAIVAIFHEGGELGTSASQRRLERPLVPGRPRPHLRHRQSAGAGDHGDLLRPHPPGLPLHHRRADDHPGHVVRARRCRSSTSPSIRARGGSSRPCHAEHQPARRQRPDTAGDARKPRRRLAGALCRRAAHDPARSGHRRDGRGVRARSWLRQANRPIGHVGGRFGRAGLDDVSVAGRMVADAQLAATAAAWPTAARRSLSSIPAASAQSWNAAVPRLASSPSVSCSRCSPSGTASW